MPPLSTSVRFKDTSLVLGGFFKSDSCVHEPDNNETTEAALPSCTMVACARP